MRITRWQRLKWTIPVVLFLTTIIDAAIPAIFPAAFLGHNQVIISHITLYFIVTFAFYFRDSNILFYAFLFGLFHDSFNTTILGLYATLYFFVAYSILLIKKYFPKKILIHAMLVILYVSIVDFVVFFFYRELGLTSMNLSIFLVNRLGHTLIFNVVLLILLYFPTRSLLRWLGYEDYIIF